LEVQAHQDFLGIRQVADDAPQRLGELLDQRRRRDDLLPLG